MNFISNLERIAKERGVTPMSIIASAGMAPVNYYRWRDGKTTPRMSAIKQLSAHLGISMSTLSGETLNSEPEELDVLQGRDDDEDGAVAPEDEKLVFIGISARTLNAIRPFITRLKGRYISVPDDLAAGLKSMCRSSTYLCKDSWNPTPAHDCTLRYGT